MTTYIRPSAVARDDADMLAGWNISPNTGYQLKISATPSGVVVILLSVDGSTLIGSGVADVGTVQPVTITPMSGQAVGMADASLGWHILLTTAGTEGGRTITMDAMVDLSARTHPVYADDDLALAVGTADINAGTHYTQDVAVSCPLGFGATVGDTASVPVDGSAVVGQVESVTWAGTPDGSTAQAVIRAHIPISPEAYTPPVVPTPPVVVDDAAETDAATEASGNVLTNDDEGLTVVAVNGLSGNVGQLVAGSNGGDFIIYANGSWTFDPAGDFSALSGADTAETSVTYHASDGVSEAMGTLTVTVSAATGATLWTPAEIPGIIVFDSLDSASIQLSGSAVTAWADMLGSGITAAQGTTSLQPAMGTGEVVFSGDYLTIASSNSAAWCKALHSTGGHVLALVQPFEISNPNAVGCLCGANGAGATANVGMVLYFDDRSSVPRNDAIVVNATRGGTGTNAVLSVHGDAVTGGAYHFVDVLIDPDNSTALSRSSCSVNGGSSLSANAATNAPSTGNASYPFQIGAGGNGVLPLTGRMKCLTITPTAISADDRARLVGWAAHRHGKTALLPPDHPYKSAAPTI